MDFYDNHRYHPYAPPADARHERYLGREWYRRDHNPFPNGHRGARNSRYIGARRGTGTPPRLLDREEMYHSPRDHRLRPSEGHFDPRYEGPQRRPSPPWYQGRSMHYGPPRPPTNYNRVHYRAAGYSPQPRLHPKSMRPASSRPTGQSNVSNAPSGSTNSNNSTAKATVSACCQQTNVSEAYKQTHYNSTGTSEPLSMDKQHASVDVKNPSVAKVVPFSHQPAPNNVKCSVGASTLSATLSSSTATNTQIKSEEQTVSQCNALLSQVSIPSVQCLNASEDGLMTIFASAEDCQLRPICKTMKSEGQTVSQCNALLSQISIPSAQCLNASEDGLMTIFASAEDGQLRPICKTMKSEVLTVSQCNALLSQVNIPSTQCLASEDGLMTIFASAEDGQLRPICRTICSCQLRQRALKYAEKGKTKNDSIIIDSDGEEEKSDTTAETFNNQVFSSTSVEDKPSGVGEPSCQDTPRKRAKMSIENNPEERSFPGDNTASDLIETDISSSVICTESVADTVARIVDGLQQSVGEGCSSTSSDSLSSLSFANVTVDAPLLANPQILQQLLDECNEISNPFKKLKISPRNLFTAAKECNVQKVLALLVGGCDPNQQVIKAKGKTAMHAAAGGGYVDIMACLRLAGCDLNLVDYENRTPFFDAVNSHKVKAVEYLIECGANLGVRDTRGMTCFHLAVRQGHTDLIKLLLKTGQFDINEKDDGGWTPIMWAAEDKQYDATQLLIEQGANVHIRDLELNVPLHWAALSGNLEVCKLLLVQHTDMNTVNIHMETPLHIAAREEHYQCVQLFVSRGAYVHIKNSDDNTPLEAAEPESRSYSLLKAKEHLESCQEHVRPRILHSDISRGQENVSISCINEVDEEPFPDFTFAKECCEIKNGTINWSISKAEGCQCERDCKSGSSCLCSESSKRQRIWYNEEGVLTGDIQRFDRPLIYECNRMCNCWSYCKNRVVQKGMQYPLQLYRTLKKGWGVRSLAEIPEGGFVCEYTGELISDSDADARDDDSYLFDLDCKENSQDLFCIDAKNYGNISRFINHSCEPNIFPLRVFINHRDIRFPRIAFFATKEINIHEEICFNYGDRFWSVKEKEFYCECGTPSCKYRDPNSQPFPHDS